MKHLQRFNSINKMKIIFTILTGIALLFMAFRLSSVDFSKDKEGGIQFHRGTWGEAIKLASKENKMIFLDIYATWCGPCKKLKTSTFSNPQVGEFYNANYINVALDGETGVGAALAQKFKIDSYPSLLFIDSNGNLIQKAVGYHNMDELISLGKNVINKN